MTKDVRIAIACPSIGVVQRGFERLFQDLFTELSDVANVTLFKGGGPSSERAKTLPRLDREGRLTNALPLHKLFGRTSMHAECLTFALALIPHLVKGKYDIVHVIDPPLSRFLDQCRSAFGLSYRILLTEGTAMEPEKYPPSDFIHHISGASMKNAIAAGHAEERMRLIPCGLNASRFTVTEEKATLRQRHGVPQDSFVILSVAALNRYHKRTDYLIDEVAALPENVFLYLDGSLSHGDPDLIGYAQAKLGSRVKISHVPTEQVPELYGLADLFVHAATFEAFGLAIVEAALADLPILTHHGDHFRWLFPRAACHIGMDEKGSLAQRIESILGSPEDLDTMKMRNYARNHYDWSRLRQDYTKLYSDIGQIV